MKAKQHLDFKIFKLAILPLVLLFLGSGVEAQSGNGVKKISGKLDYKSYLIPKYYHSPTFALMDFSYAIKGDADSLFVPIKSQILGRSTSPIYPSPTTFEIDLPIQPNARFVNFDKKNSSKQGVQVFYAQIGLNMYGDSYLDQLEQNGYQSVTLNSETEQISKGTLLIYASDNKQVFPKNWGKDKKMFTADDEVTNLETGYTLATIKGDGSIQFSRDSNGVMDLLEPTAKNDTPDFSQMGLVEAYNALIDLLKERYAYTKKRNLDWEKIRAKYLDEIEAAEKRKDTGDYFIAIKDLSISLKDAHVQTSSYDMALVSKYYKKLGELWGGSLGVTVVELTDGRFVLTNITENSPAQKVGWVVGTEIVSVNGKKPAERMEDIPINTSKGTDESIALERINFFFNFPIGTNVAVAFKNPNQTKPQKVQLVTQDVDSFTYSEKSCDRNATDSQISYKFFNEGNIGYIRWKNFEEIPVTLATYEDFLLKVNDRKGIIIDLRGNSGGLLILMYTMTSYFFPEQNPAPLNWLDLYNYDPRQHEFIKAGSNNMKIYSPNSNLYYPGKIVVLVDDKSASAAEYFSQYLQSQNRATVIAEHGTEGAGGILAVVTLPKKQMFTYTGGQTYFANTKEVNLEGKGVTPDIRVPITLENELKKQQCEDVVLQTAIEFLTSDKE
ncbi:S41 family peptidase [Pseudotamlana agarivorans]|uniref:S41 family peptidase n=1 Tax=Pseudotamlana agarivorans TaxID=481183 RepID=UPI0008304599|nr:S41 family peptidase [Tamlana agarivorans]